jgi:hypothetical protein
MVEFIALRGQRFDVSDGVTVIGMVQKINGLHDFAFRPRERYLTPDQLRAIADKLDELNEQGEGDESNS